LLEEETLEIHTVIAKGQVMVSDRKYRFLEPLKKGNRLKELLEKIFL
jgi:hypothetical protein